MEQLAVEIVGLCREYGECRVEVERMEEARRVKNALESVCAMARQRLDISDPALLLALLDACEVTRDEGMLQEVLDVVGRNLDRLAVSAESVKLLACCYYYVEEEECVERAGKDAGGVEEDGKGGRRIGGCGNHFRRIDLGGDFRTDPGRLRTCPFGGGRSVA